MGLISYKRRLAVDYSKWLGPNYKVRYDGAGINVSNHLSFFDITCMLALQDPICGYIAKAEMLTSGGGGAKYIADIIGILFISRDTKASKEERDAMIDQIRER